MSRGRPRKYNPAIPEHIDQRQIPRGCYFDAKAKCWYTLRPTAPRWQRLAGAKATLADLHAQMERLTVDDRGTLAWLHRQFQDSDLWKHLSKATHKDYNACQSLLARTRTSAGPYASLIADRLEKVHLQQLVDTIGKDRPAMANHVKRYLSRLFKWSMAHGKCRDRDNPAKDLEAATEKRQHKMPTRAAMVKAITFARERGARQAHTAGSCPPYLWIVMTLAYRMRLRGIEVVTLTDAHDTPAGVRTNRRKGSRDNTTRWAGAIEDAVLAAWDYRDAVWKRTNHIVPLRAEERSLVVTQTGDPVNRETLSSAWQRFAQLMIAEGVITPAERFTLHGLKHRGITDTKGDKQQGSGHVDPRMLKLYDHEVPLVDQAGE